jgi:hypothetical protein
MISCDRAKNTERNCGFANGIYFLILNTWFFRNWDLPFLSHTEWLRRGWIGNWIKDCIRDLENAVLVVTEENGLSGRDDLTPKRRKQIVMHRPFKTVRN